MQAIAKNG